MHCELNPKIIYTEFTSVIRRQKDLIKNLIYRQQRPTYKPLPGLTIFKQGTRPKCVGKLNLLTIYFRELKGDSDRADPGYTGDRVPCAGTTWQKRAGAGGISKRSWSLRRASQGGFELGQGAPGLLAVPGTRQQARGQRLLRTYKIPHG